MATLSYHERMRLSEEKSKNWLNSVNPEEFDDLESVVSSMVDSSIVDSSDSESGQEQQLGIRTRDTTASVSNIKKSHFTDITELPNYNDVLNLNCIEDQLQQLAPIPTYSNVSISNSTNVKLGNIIKIKGNLNINVINNNEIGEDRDKPDQEATNVIKREVTQHKRESKVYRPACLIISRRRWLAMDPLNECKYMKGPVDLVIISHTATAGSTNQPGNIGIIRDMQMLHIEHEGWNDIIFNFLIGGDGNVYEGRGWDVEGDHTLGYNNKSIGISFVGSLRKLPTERALKACKNLLIRGVAEGHLSENYKLLAQCQCSSNNSTGTELYEEIKKWEHFYDKNKDNGMDKIEKFIFKEK